MDLNRASQRKSPERRPNRWNEHKPLVLIIVAQLVALAATMAYLNSDFAAASVARVDSDAHIAAGR